MPTPPRTPRSTPLGIILLGILFGCAVAWKLHSPAGVEEQLLDDDRTQQLDARRQSPLMIANDGGATNSATHPVPVWREPAANNPFVRPSTPNGSKPSTFPVTTETNPRFAQVPAWARNPQIAKRQKDPDDLLDDDTLQSPSPLPPAAPPQRLPAPPDYEDDLLAPAPANVEQPPAVTPSLPMVVAPPSEAPAIPVEPAPAPAVPTAPPAGGNLFAPPPGPKQIINPTLVPPAADDDDLLVPEKAKTGDDQARPVPASPLPGPVFVPNPTVKPVPAPVPSVPSPAVPESDDDLLSPPVKPSPGSAPRVPSTPPSQGLFPSPPSPQKSESRLVPSRPEPEAAPAVQGPTPVDPHWALFAKNCYPSAKECATCHQQHYDEWSVSSHAYACVSPMFNKFEQKINDLAQGTIGYFCLRCHAGAGVAMGMRRDTPLWEMPQVAREGVTCIVCHRINQSYGKVNGERHIVPGPITDPIYGPLGGDGVREAIAKADFFKVKTVPDKNPGQIIHGEGRFFTQLNKSEFCESCHQVAVNPGIKLEVVWEQYRASPACKQGIKCQDCHMGKVPGKAEGYACGPAAIMSGKVVNPQRKHSNHIFHGPGYSIAHPGIFPFHTKADRWSPDQWLTFDWRAGWGLKEFEDRVARGEIRCSFPPVWREADDRMDAREIIDANMQKLAFKREVRVQSMENGSRVDGPNFDSQLCQGNDLHFHFVVTNTNPGHNLLTASLGAQPQMWLNVALVGPDGRKVWESGYTDQYGDLCDIHSDDVRHKRMPFDSQLFNLQTMFLITNVKGADREFPLPVNVDFDQLPFIRPGAQPISVLNHPPFIRMEARSLSPLGSRRASYKVPGHLLRQPGEYRLTYRMRNRTEPIYFMRFCETTTEQQRAMNEGILDIHRNSVTFQLR